MLFKKTMLAAALALFTAALAAPAQADALDPELVNEVLRAVEQLAREGMTLILVTHEMRFARDVGTKLVFMHHGRVHEEGVPKEVFAAPRTAELQQFVGSIG
jgi:polar amino acid transport system ATP-binding protein